eukprot:GHVU01001563.1.p1 GENE.GHVU01001563.1~~GHVU01001563.1.p1  ORF type:complete len:113 (+),score=6.70 GHVU01001563.1:276-614(+)
MSTIMLGQAGPIVEPTFDSGSRRNYLGRALVTRLEQTEPQLVTRMLPQDHQIAVTCDLQQVRVAHNMVVVRVSVFRTAQEPLVLEEVPFYILEEPSTIAIIGASTLSRLQAL